MAGKGLSAVICSRYGVCTSDLQTLWRKFFSIRARALSLLCYKIKLIDEIGVV